MAEIISKDEYERLSHQIARGGYYTPTDLGKVKAYERQLREMARQHEREYRAWQLGDAAADGRTSGRSGAASESEEPAMNADHTTADTVKGSVPGIVWLMLILMVICPLLGLGGWLIAGDSLKNIKLPSGASTTLFGGGVVSTTETLQPGEVRIGDTVFSCTSKVKGQDAPGTWLDPATLKVDNWPVGVNQEPQGFCFVDEVAYQRAIGLIGGVQKAVELTMAKGQKTGAIWETELMKAFNDSVQPGVHVLKIPGFKVDQGQQMPVSGSGPSFGSSGGQSTKVPTVTPMPTMTPTPRPMPTFTPTPIPSTLAPQRIDLPGVTVDQITHGASNTQDLWKQGQVEFVQRGYNGSWEGCAPSFNDCKVHVPYIDLWPLQQPATYYYWAINTPGVTLRMTFARLGSPQFVYSDALPGNPGKEYYAVDVWGSNGVSVSPALYAPPTPVPSPMPSVTPWPTTVYETTATAVPQIQQTCEYFDFGALTQNVGGILTKLSNRGDTSLAYIPDRQQWVGLGSSANYYCISGVPSVVGGKTWRLGHGTQVYFYAPEDLQYHPEIVLVPGSQVYVSPVE